MFSRIKAMLESTEKKSGTPAGVGDQGHSHCAVHEEKYRGSDPPPGNRGVAFQEAS